MGYWVDVFLDEFITDLSESKVEKILKAQGISADELTAVAKAEGVTKEAGFLYPLLIFQMATLTQRVVRRFLFGTTKTAVAIGNPKEILEKILNRFHDTKLEEFEKLLPEAREGLRLYQEQLKGYHTTPEIEQKIKTWHSVRYDYAIQPGFTFRVFKNLGAHELYLAILQQYQLSPKLRKAIEAASKFFSRSTIHKPKDDLAALALFDKTITDYRKHFAVAQLALEQGILHGEESQTKIRAGAFTLVNTGGFDQDTMLQVAGVVEKADKLMRGIGLGKVCYGDILVTNTLARANVLAFYYASKDELFVRANFRGNLEEIIRTICHELGHRAEHFLKDKQHEIAKLYRLMAHDEQAFQEQEEQRLLSDPSLKPKPGEEVCSKGKVYVVDEYTIGARRGFHIPWVVKLHQKDKPQARGQIDLLGYAKLKGIIGHSMGKFVTPYAKKSPSENFAEMVSFYAIGKLPETLIELLKPIIS